jgi:hypothetical protein
MNPMKKWRWYLIAGAAWVMAAAAAARAEPPALSQGETIYVPVYSHILHGNLDSRGNANRVLLSSMLSIRNTDPRGSILIRSVRYYDTEGMLLREYEDAARRLGPLASTDVLVEHKDSAGGTGANFLVVWEAESPINPPITETINVYLFGSQSVAFTSPGQPIRTEGSSR